MCRMGIIGMVRTPQAIPIAAPMIPIIFPVAMLEHVDDWILVIWKEQCHQSEEEE